MAFLVVFSLVVFGGIGLAIAFVFWTLNTRRALTDSWAATAHRLGLHYDGRSIEGTMHGQWVRAGTFTRGSGQNRRTYTRVAAKLQLPLDLGLSLRRHGIMNDMFHGSGDHIIGDPLFDQTFIVSADEAHRVGSLFGPKLRHLLLQQVANSNSFRLEDTGARIESSGMMAAERLAWALETVSRITKGVDLARGSVPVATPLAHHQHAWRTFASANSLRGHDTPLCMWGRLEGGSVRVYAVRTNRLFYEMEIEVTLETPLGIGLWVRAIGLMDKLTMLFGSQDIKLGDAFFDDAFRVQASEPELAKAVLDETVRGELMLVQQDLGPIVVNDQAITVRLKVVPHHPAVVPQAVRRLTGVADALTQRVNAITVGPYR